MNGKFPQRDNSRPRWEAMAERVGGEQGMVEGRKERKEVL